MNFFLKIAWHAALTALAVTLISGLFLLGLPREYQATATVVGNSADALLFESAEVMNLALISSRVEMKYLVRWYDRLLGRSGHPLVRLRDSIDISLDQGVGHIHVSVSAADPGVAATLANALVEAFLQKVRLLSVSPETKNLLSSRVDAVAAEMQAFLDASPDARDFPGWRARLQEQERLLVREQRDIAARLDQLGARIEQAGQGDMAAFQQEPDVQRALRERDRLLLRESELSTRYGAQHQKMRATRAQIVAADSMVKREVDAATARFERQRQQVGDEQAANAQALEQLLLLQQGLSAAESDWQKLQAAHTSALRQFESGSLPEDERRYAAALPPDSALGLSLLNKLMVVFALTFFPVALLLLLRPWVRSHG